MNPFKYGQVVCAKDFCPRPELLKQLIGAIQSGQNVAIQGERRIGKTSLIYEAVRKSRGHQMLYVDLLEIKTTEDLCKRIVTALVQLTGQQLKCLTGLARMGGKSPLSADFLKGVGIALPASVKKALNRLMQLKIVYRHQGEYKFVNPFFRSWLIWKNY